MCKSRKYYSDRLKNFLESAQADNYQDGRYIWKNSYYQLYQSVASNQRLTGLKQWHQL
ncbi:MAG: hypothetical protein MGG11_01120 [Trichodesmium sp. MAG_R03]|nr:hypothetical protein [Trichodesmium sp. MAG_R03]